MRRRIDEKMNDGWRHEACLYCVILCNGMLPGSRADLGTRVQVQGKCGPGSSMVPLGRGCGTKACKNVAGTLLGMFVKCLGAAVISTTEKPTGRLLHLHSVPGLDAVQ